MNLNTTTTTNNNTTNLKYIEYLNNIFNNVKNDYKCLYKKLPDILNNGLVSSYDLLTLEVAFNDLSIQIQSIISIQKFNKKNKHNMYNHSNSLHQENNILESESESESEDDPKNDTETETDYNTKYKNKELIDRAFKEFTPYIFLYLMLIDKSSILYSKDEKENDSNDLSDEEKFKKVNNFNYIINSLD